MKFEKKIFLAKSYSNIAIVKYWGKHIKQIPANVSISFTLNKCFSETEMIFIPKKKKDNNFSVKVFLSGIEKKEFVNKIILFFKRIFKYCPYLLDFNFIIKTINNFPHSSGIASSASSMSSLSLCLMKFEKSENLISKKYNYLQRASFLARFGSGSACRSIYPGLVVWGKHRQIINSSNKYAIKYPYDIHKIFMTYCNTILIIDSNIKKITSSYGHRLMNKNPYSLSRYKIANKNIEKIIPILKNGDVDSFGKIIEEESLHLHAMLISSNPYILLIKPNTLHVIENIILFRKETNIPLYFSLDAGANIHLLYPMTDYNKINHFIVNNLLKYCFNKKYIQDYCFFN